jgi:hypothetical protein
MVVQSTDTLNNIEICPGDMYPNFLNTDSVSGGREPYTYEWQFKIDNENWVAISNSNSVNFRYDASLGSNINNNISFRRKVTDKTEVEKYSSLIVIREAAIPVVNILGLDDAYCQTDTVTIEAFNEGDRIDKNYSFIDELGILTDSLNGRGGFIAKSNDLVAYDKEFSIGLVYTDDKGCVSDTSFATTKIDSLPKFSISLVVEDTVSKVPYCFSTEEEFEVNTFGLAGTLSFIYGNLTEIRDRFTVPKNNLGTNRVVYEVSSDLNRNCIGTDTLAFIINPLPEIDFNVAELDRCVSDSVLFEDQSKITEGTIDEKIWEIEDTTIVSDSFFYLFESAGLKDVNLKLISDQKCESSQTFEKIDFVEDPVVDFSWVNECESDEPTSFTVTSISLTGDFIDNYNWDFGDGSVSNLESPSHDFKEAGEYEVSLTVTSGYTCIGNQTKAINIRPFEKFSDGGFYFEDFEENKGGWQQENATGSENSWSRNDFSLEGNQIISEAFSGDHAWVTNPNGDYTNNEQSWVTSPCFTLDNLTKPMISFKLHTAFTDANDGVVLQYRYESDSTISGGAISDWENLESVGEGISWFNSTTIDAQPGGTTGFGRGWSGVSISDDDSTWVDVRIGLDTLKEITDVNFIRFRIALGSDQNRVSEGVAFDDVRIGNRNKILLHEYFTNTKCDDCKVTDNQVTALTDQFTSPRDVIALHYHTSSLIGDPIATVNPVASAIRENNYTVPSIPYSAFNGDLFLGATADWLVANPKADLEVEALRDPKVDLNLSVKKEGVLVKAVVAITANESFSANAGAYFVVVEKSVEIDGDVFSNVVRHVEQYTASLPLNWIEGETAWATMNWELKYFDDPNDFAVVAFVQDLSGNVDDREIYQATYTENTNDVLSLDQSNDSEDVFLGEEIVLYPNPTTEDLYLLNAPKNTNVEFYSQDGLLVKTFKVRSSADYTTMKELPSGVYLVRLNYNQKYIVTHKVVKY